MSDTDKTTVEEPLAVWMGAVTHILDQLAYAAGLEIDRTALIDSYNAFTGECWTSAYLKQEKNSPPKRSAESMTDSPTTTIDLATFKRRFDIRMNEHLAEMKPEHDDSIVGFHDAWDVVRKLFEDMQNGK